MEKYLENQEEKEITENINELERFLGPIINCNENLTYYNPNSLPKPNAPIPAVNADPIGLGAAAGTPLVVVTVPPPGVSPVIP